MHPLLFTLKFHIFSSTAFILSAILLFIIYLVFYLPIVKNLFSKNKLTKSYNLIRTILFISSLTTITLIILSIFLNKREIEIDSYSVFFGLGYTAAIIISYFKCKKENILKTDFLLLNITLIISSIIGARLFFALFEYSIPNKSAPFAFLSNPGIILSSEAGFIIYGGLILGFIGCIIHAKILKLPIKKLSDIIAPSIGIGIFLGRIGCMLNGCCFGKKYSGILSTSWKTFKPQTGAFDFHFYYSNGIDYTILNTQIISAFFGLTIFLFLSFLYYKKSKVLKGLLIVIFFLFYSIFRFIIEFFRADNPNSYFGFTLAQFISILIFSLTIIILFNSIRKRIKPNEKL